MTRWLRARRNDPVPGDASAGRRRGPRPGPSVLEYLVAVVAVAAVVIGLLATFVPSVGDALIPSSASQDGSEDAAPEQPEAAAASDAPSGAATGSTSAPSPTPSSTAPEATPTPPAITPPTVTFPTLKRLDRAMARKGLTRVPARAWEGATFTLASFNVLGASHTRGPKRRAGYAGAEQRLPGQLEMIAAKGITVAGLQEFQFPQVGQLRDLTGDDWGIFPGLELGNWRADNSIIWRTDEWEKLTTRTVDIPYFHGNMIPMPYVLLEHRTSGRRVWFANFHNPADVAGEAGKWRDQATQREASLARELSADGTPVIVTGDMNDRSDFACPFSSASGMYSPNGAMTTDGRCVLPGQLDVDWIFGTRDLLFSDFESDRSSQDRKLTDHPLVSATAALPGVEDRPECSPRISVSGVAWYCPTEQTE